MPFLPEDKTLSDARKEAASAGFKSMTEAAKSSEDRMKADTNAASLIQDEVWGGGAGGNFKDKYGIAPQGSPDGFKGKYGVDHYDITRLMNDKLSKHITMSSSMKKDYEAAVAADKKASDVGDAKVASTTKATTDIKAATTPTPRRAQD